MVSKRAAGQKRMIRTGSWFPFFELGFMHNILPYRPDDALKASTSPILLAYGGLDLMARAEQSVDRLNEIFPDGLPENIMVYVDQTADHFFHITDDFCFDYEASKEATYSDEFISRYKSWLEEYVFRQKE
ncbi:MAG: hypothetical protein JEY99_16215 [Spirochaetales bacterium]|nr:hypothetical protein [Spirochaetales bacterium]